MAGLNLQRAAAETGKRLESFSIGVSWIDQAADLRLDASFFNQRVMNAISKLERSGYDLKPLSEVTQKVFIPPRFKRVYVEREHGVPFLQGGHVVHFQPADLKYLSHRAHKRIERWIIRSGWVLVTCSGTIGRVTTAPPAWDGWAASQHILRIVPNDDGVCPTGYLSTFLSSELGQAQLTSQTYGAVVDEITEEQAQRVLIPIAKTEDQRKKIEAIDRSARRALALRNAAILRSQQAQAAMANLF